MTDYRYELAISFLSEHEDLALRVSDGLTDRFPVFVYSREQPEVVGRNTDGVEAFTNVFRHDARVCLILHSEGWGASGYTQIEESAIKERALQQGWEFLLVACVDQGRAPKWLPTTKIWYGYEKFGLNGLLAALDNRVTELGGRPAKDPVAAKAARVQRERDFAAAAKLYLTSTQGSAAADAEFNRFRSILEARAQELNGVYPELALSVVENRGSGPSVSLSGPLGSFVLNWIRQFSNQLEGATLAAVELSGRFIYGGMGGGPRQLRRLEMNPVLGQDRKPAWEVPELDRALTSEAVVDHLLDRLLSRLQSGPRTARGGARLIT